MKYVKMLGFAAIAAMALMAFVAGSASATTLDGPNGVLKAGSTISASLTAGTSGSLTSTGGETLDTCTAGTVTGTTTNETGATVGLSVPRGGITWGATNTTCTNKTETIAGGTLEIAWTSGNNGSVMAKEVEVTVLTPFIGTTCIYTAGTGTTLGTLSGGEPATLAVNAVVGKTSGSSFLCPSSSKWVAKYTVTIPTKLGVTN